MKQPYIIKPIKRYKALCLDPGGWLRSCIGYTIWDADEWYKIDGNLKMCVNGFHCCFTMYDAKHYYNEYSRRDKKDCLIYSVWVKGSFDSHSRYTRHGYNDPPKECYRYMKLDKLVWTYGKEALID